MGDRGDSVSYIDILSAFRSGKSALPAVIGSASVVGECEYLGPLGTKFDLHSSDNRFVISQLAFSLSLYESDA